MCEACFKSGGIALLWDLFKTFLKVGSFTIGGGYAMIPLIQSEVVDKKKWLSSDEFVDTLAVAQSTPGALAVNMSAYVGYRKAGLAGAFAATLGCSLPAIIPILIIAIFFNKFMDIEVVKKAFMGFRPAVAALIVYSVYKIAKAGKIKRNWYLVTIIATLSIILFKMDPLVIIVVSGIAGSVFGRGALDDSDNS
jgi:chromate transporter